MSKIIQEIEKQRMTREIPDFKPGDTVVVTGPGPVGILSAMAARFAGASAVVIIGRAGASEQRLAVAPHASAD